MFRRRDGIPDGETAVVCVISWLGDDDVAAWWILPINTFSALVGSFFINNEWRVEYFGLCWTRPDERAVRCCRLRDGVNEPCDGGGLNEEFNMMEDVDVELWLPGENAANWFGVFVELRKLVEMESVLGGE